MGERGQVEITIQALSPRSAQCTKSHRLRAELTRERCYIHQLSAPRQHSGTQTHTQAQSQAAPHKRLLSGCVGARCETTDKDPPQKRPPPPPLHPHRPPSTLTGYHLADPPPRLPSSFNSWLDPSFISTCHQACHMSPGMSYVTRHVGPVAFRGRDQRSITENMQRNNSTVHHQ